MGVATLALGVEVKGGVPESRSEARMLHGLSNAWLLELDWRNNLLKISNACEIYTALPLTNFFSICNFFFNFKSQREGQGE